MDIANRAIGVFDKIVCGSISVILPVVINEIIIDDGFQGFGELGIRCL